MLFGPHHTRFILTETIAFSTMQLSPQTPNDGRPTYKVIRQITNLYYLYTSVVRLYQSTDGWNDVSLGYEKTRVFVAVAIKSKVNVISSEPEVHSLVMPRRDMTSLPIRPIPLPPITKSEEGSHLWLQQ